MWRSRRGVRHDSSIYRHLRFRPTEKQTNRCFLRTMKLRLSASFGMLHINDCNSANHSHLQLWHHSVGRWWLRRGGAGWCKDSKKRTRANTPHTSTYAHTQSINRTRHQAGDPQQTQQVKTCGGFYSALSRRPADDLFVVVILSNLWWILLHHVSSHLSTEVLKDHTAGFHVLILHHLLIYITAGFNFLAG